MSPQELLENYCRYLVEIGLNPIKACFSNNTPLVLVETQPKEEENDVL
jgi:hypothetical protein